MTQTTKTLSIFCFVWSVLPVTLSRGRMVPVPILLASRQNSYYIDDLIRQRINDVKTNKLNSHRITWLTNNSQITVMNSLFSSSHSRLLIALLFLTTANDNISQLLRLAGHVASSCFIKQCEFSEFSVGLPVIWCHSDTCRAFFALYFTILLVPRY